MTEPLTVATLSRYLGVAVKGHRGRWNHSDLEALEELIEVLVEWQDDRTYLTEERALDQRLDRHAKRLVTAQGYVPTAEDVATCNAGASHTSGRIAERLHALASRLKVAPPLRTYTRDEVLRIATAAATMHNGYPGKGWNAADAALMAIEAERSPKEEG